MDQERAHDEHAASPSDTFDRSLTGGEAADRLVGEHTQLVGSGQDSQRTIRRRRVIEMDTKSDHAGQSARGGMSVENARLDGPGSPSGGIESLPQRQRR